jgi:hypothetical protein
MSDHDLIHFHRRSDDCPEAVVPPPGMTVEQLDFFTEQTQRAVRKATRRDRAVNRIAYVILTAGLVVSLFVAGREGAKAQDAVVSSGRAVAVEGCNRDFEDRVRFRDLLQRLKAASEAAARQGRTTPEQRDAAVAFYDRELKRFGLPDCRKSANLLTSDPEDSVPNIAPFYPGAAYLPKDDG